MGIHLTEMIGGNRVTSIGSDHVLTVGRNFTTSVGARYQFTAGQDIYIESANQITLKSGTGSIIIRKNGNIEFTGNVVLPVTPLTAPGKRIIQ